MKKIAVVILACILFYNTSITCQAASKDTEAEINKTIIELSTGLKNIIYLQIQMEEDNLRSEIVKNEWDYVRTFESLDKENISNADYVEMLAAYMTAKKYRDQPNTFEYLGYLPLITTTKQIHNTTVTIPVDIPEYKPFGDGYIQTGSKFITETSTVTTYVEREGLFYPESEIEVIPETKEIEYAETSFKIMTGEDILAHYELNNNDNAMEYFENLKDQIKRFTTSQNIAQSMYAFISGDGELFTIDTTSLGNSELRTAVINNALHLVGRIPYQWGGKPTKPGYDTTWGTYNEFGEQLGLDCSGFVEWVYMTTGFDETEYKKMASTYEMLGSDMPQIPKSSIKAGDIGVMVGDVNHAGIYLGNVEGKDLWIHCNKSAGTVSVGEFNNFMIFYSPLTAYEEGEKEIDKFNDLGYYTNIGNSEQVYSDEDVYLLAQLIVHEAGGEGLNGWIAVAEVVRNRIASEEYPNTIPEVALQPWQFSYFYEDNGIIPPENIIKVARNVIEGRLSILCNEDVLYYKNPVIVDGIEPTEVIPWGQHQWFTSIGGHAFYLK